VDIGIVPSQDRRQGGVFQYGTLVLRALAQQPFSPKAHRISVIGTPAAHQNVAQYAAPDWQRVALHPFLSNRRAAGVIRAVIGEAATGKLANWVRRKEARRAHDGLVTQPAVGKMYRQHGVKFIFWTYSNALAFECGVPFIAAVHDLQHRVQPDFMSTHSRGDWESREFLFRSIARAATLLVADSEVGREDILDAYGDLLRPDQVKVLPFIPPPHLSSEDAGKQIEACRACWKLPVRYVFYPAQFWPHKNHEMIVRAIALLKERGNELGAVFAGSWHDDYRRPTYRKTMELASALGVAERICVLGFVPDELIGGLYLGAQALVMPTLMGPTTIPVLEAWMLGCPVVTSDIRGLKEQAGLAALLVDPHSPEELADAVIRVTTDEELRVRLVGAGYQRLAAWTAQDFTMRVGSILEEGYALAGVAEGAR
jgi:glycosyltransferase involved in cell wall biosynthesis